MSLTDTNDELCSGLVKEILQYADFYPAPIKTLWGQEMQMADIALDEDRTVSVYVLKDDIDKYLDSIKETHDEVGQTAQIAELKETLFNLVEKSADVVAWDFEDSGNHIDFLADLINLRSAIGNIKSKHFPTIPCPPRGYTYRQTFKLDDEDD